MAPHHASVESGSDEEEKPRTKYADHTKPTVTVLEKDDHSVDSGYSSKTNITGESLAPQAKIPKKAAHVKVKAIKTERTRSSSVGAAKLPATSKPPKRSSSKAPKPEVTHQLPQQPNHHQPPPSAPCRIPGCSCQFNLPIHPPVAPAAAPPRARQPLPYPHPGPPHHIYANHPSQPYHSQPVVNHGPPSVYAQPLNVAIPRPRTYSQGNTYPPPPPRPASFHQDQYPPAPIYHHQSPSEYGPSPISQVSPHGYPSRAPSPAHYQQPHGYPMQPPHPQLQHYDYPPPQRPQLPHAATNSQVARQATHHYPSAFVEQHYMPRSATAGPAAGPFAPPRSHDYQDHDKKAMPPPPRPVSMAPRRESFGRPPPSPSYRNSVRFDEASLCEDDDYERAMYDRSPMYDDDEYEDGFRRAAMVIEAPRRASSVRQDRPRLDPRRRVYYQSQPEVAQARTRDVEYDLPQRPRQRRSNTVNLGDASYVGDRRTEASRKVADAERYISEDADRMSTRRIPLTSENVKNNRITEPSNTGRRRQMHSGSYSQSGTSSGDSGDGTSKSNGRLRLEIDGQHIEYDPQTQQVVIGGSRKQYHGGSQRSDKSRGTRYSAHGLDGHDRVQSGGQPFTGRRSTRTHIEETFN